MKIAVLDSGFDFSQPLQNKITNINFTDETNKDENGHGTCIIKLIDSISSGLELYSIKILDRTGKGKLSSLKVALLEALNSDVRYFCSSMCHAVNTNIYNNNQLKEKRCEQYKNLLEKHVWGI